MLKQVTFQTEGLGQCFAEALTITPKGAGFTKIAGAVHPEIARYLRTLQKDPRYQYVLMTPMGSFEYWGMNANGDIFPDLSLSFDRDNPKADPAKVARELERKWMLPLGGSLPPGDYRNFGYRTFVGAQRYRHHQNKDPNLSYGEITVSVWNPQMHRVELIARHDREKARALGAYEIIDDLDNGKSRQISMGCRVPFDVCTKCGHAARTPNEYCDHLRLWMGTVQGDGTVIGAVNLFPAFFELSDVVVPAAKESGVLMKVASQNRSEGTPQCDVKSSGCSGVADKEILWAGGRGKFRTCATCFTQWKRKTPSQSQELVSVRSIDKTATIKRAATRKIAEMDKVVLPNTPMQQLADSEPSLPDSLLTMDNFPQLLTTLAMLGVLLRPQEFQYGCLNAMGHGGLAEQLRQQNFVFEQGPVEIGAFSEDDFNPMLARLLGDTLPGRSAFLPYLPVRTMRITIQGSLPSLSPAAEGPLSILKTASALYSQYRYAVGSMGRTLANVVDDNYDVYRTHFFSPYLEKRAFAKDWLHNVPCPLYLKQVHLHDSRNIPELEIPAGSAARLLVQGL